MKNTELCRCCLTDFCFKDMCNEYVYNGVKETYRDMILDTFNLRLSQNPSSRELICEDCIVKLRGAAAFKTQVLQAEDTFVNNLLSIVKTEDRGTHSHECEEDYFEDTISSDNDFWDTTPVHKLNDDKELNVNSEVRATVREILTPIRNKNVTPKTVQKSVANCKVNPANIKRIRKRTDRKPNLELERVRENTLSLLLNSNMCLFKSLKTKYRCAFCSQAFISIQLLREHCKVHSNTKDIERKIKFLSGLSFKSVDISNLACKLCSESCEDLNELGTHLKNKHNIPFRNSEHFLIPYKLENGFECLMCSEHFRTFLRLSVHMNSHFTNHVCEICAASFINRLSLRMHVQSLHTVKSCNICNATFHTGSAKAIHMRKSHNQKPKIYKKRCLECNESFDYTYLLDQHKISAHGAKKSISKCEDCGKIFLSENNLKIHKRSVHLQERNYPCSVCDRRFFTSTDKKRHEKTHEDIRSFSCNYCESKFKAKDSLRKHLKRQHGQGK